MVKCMLKSQGEGVLWVSVSPSLKCFDVPLLRALMVNRAIAPSMTPSTPSIAESIIAESIAPSIQQWTYEQTLDEASSFEEAIALLVSYLERCDRPVHLVGHGLSGVVAMMATARCAEKVRSLALLGTSVLPGLTWHAHYYLQRFMTPCSQSRILANCARSLWGQTSPYSIRSLVRVLEKDLLLAPSPHSLYAVRTLNSVDIPVPKFVAGGDQDFVISPAVFHLWDEQMGPGDRLYEVPGGSHFFQVKFAADLARELLQFWTTQGMGKTESMDDRDRSCQVMSNPKPIPLRSYTPPE
jgi:pimeloyl-ACP methyl ester carboxylesterase